LVSKKVTKPSAKLSARPAVAPNKVAAKATSQSVTAPVLAKGRGIKPNKQLSKTAKPIKQTVSAKVVALKKAKRVVAPKVDKKSKVSTSKSPKAAKKAAPKAKRSKK
jgi:hypothetical protein